MDEILLLVAVFLPMVGALLLGRSREAARQCALGISVLVLVVAGILVFRYPAGEKAFAQTWFCWFGGLVRMNIFCRG